MPVDQYMKQIKGKYKIIFNWLKENNLYVVTEMFEAFRDGAWSNERLIEYLQLLIITDPVEANLEQMYSVANNINCGPLERFYQQKVNNEIALGLYASQLVELYNELKATGYIDSPDEEFIGVVENNGLTKSEYFEIAKEIYSEVVLDNDINIGGRVALCDTNWEFQKITNSSKIFFRTLSSLNMTEINEPDNLFELAKQGTIIIESIKV